MNHRAPLYPLKFHPIPKQKVWGGSKLHSLFNRPNIENIGESWEISGIEGSISLVSNGPLAGKSLQWLLDTYEAQLVGQEVFNTFGTKFPLLFKFIDAREDLSVQVHPDDVLAKERHDSFGKTEMWYILDAEKTARLILGFKEKVNKEIYNEALRKNAITDILNSVAVKKGDTFILTPGTVHAIGAGIVLAEIQQTSDITYRIYDWDRPDTDGKLRQLHTELAMEAIDFSPTKGKIGYRDQINLPVQVGATAYFGVNKLTLSKDFSRDLSKIHSFVVYMCLEGNATLLVNGYRETMVGGETILIPAHSSEVSFQTKSASFLEVYIP